MADPHLPAAFQDLEPYLEWSLPTERQRSAKRQASTITQLSAFYHILLPRMDAVLTYLAGYPLDTTVADVKHLSYLTLSLAEIAPAVENFGQPSVIDGYDVARFNALHE